MTNRQYADHRGVSAGRISQLKPKLQEAGAIMPDGRIDATLADEVLGGSRPIIVPAAAPSARSEEASLTVQRTKLTALQVEERELSLAELRGELIRKSDVESAAFDTQRVIRDRLLAIPQEEAGRFVGITDESQAAAILTKVLTDRLHKLADAVARDGSP